MKIAGFGSVSLRYTDLNRNNGLSSDEDSDVPQGDSSVASLSNIWSKAPGTWPGCRRPTCWISVLGFGPEVRRSPAECQQWGQGSPALEIFYKFRLNVKTDQTLHELEFQQESCGTAFNLSCSELLNPPRPYPVFQIALSMSYSDFSWKNNANFCNLHNKIWLLSLAIKNQVKKISLDFWLRIRVSIQVQKMIQNIQTKLVHCRSRLR